jgi:hypothetical protein
MKPAFSSGPVNHRHPGEPTLSPDPDTWGPRPWRSVVDRAGELSNGGGCDYVRIRGPQICGEIRRPAWAPEE